MDNELNKTTLRNEIEALHLAREELLLEAFLDHADVNGEWDRLDDALRFAQSEINRLGDQSGDAVREIEDASRAVLAEIREGYERIRAQAARAKQRDRTGMR